MRRLLLIIIIVFFLPSWALARPFLTCDPQKGVTHYKVTWLDTGEEEISLAKPDGSAYHDFENVPAGNNKGEISARGIEHTLDGIGQGFYDWSSPTPFLYRKPPDIGSPTGTHLEE